MSRFDHIVIGGGSAGCTIAARLAEGGRRVLLLEEGPRDRSPTIHLPVLVYKTATGPLLRRYVQEPSPALDPDRPLPTVQGRVLGGGSSINGMLYVRGLPRDYDEWAALGATGWSYADVLPWFRKSEGNRDFAGPAHGSDGGLRVSKPGHVSPLTKAWVQACLDWGMPPRADFNAGDQTGAGIYQATLGEGRRSSSATAFLHPLPRAIAPKVEAGAEVRRILIENRRAVGVVYRRGGRDLTARCAGDVILSAGALNSPRLLMLSGIGDPGHLAAMGIAPQVALPGVGQNLQDHMDCYLIYELQKPGGYDPYKRLGNRLRAGLEYALFRSGPITSNIIEGGAFWTTNPEDPYPDIQLAFLPGSGIEDGVEPVASGYGCTLNVCHTRPKSRGTVTLSGPDPSLPPRIAPNYLSDPRDMAAMARGVLMAQQIMGRDPIRGLLRSEVTPGRPLSTLEDAMTHVRAMAQGALHPVGTCAIGPVVTPDSQVRGIDGLRVADASVMPTLPSGNTNAASIMIGERAADFVLRAAR